VVVSRVRSSRWRGARSATPSLAISTPVTVACSYRDVATEYANAPLYARAAASG
jgi:hypothetical protein